MRLKSIVGFAITFFCGFSPLCAQRVSPLRDVPVHLVSVADSGTYLVYTYRVVNSASSKAGATTVAVELTAPDQAGYATLPATGTFMDSTKPGGVGDDREHVPVGTITAANWIAHLTKEGWLFWFAAQGDVPWKFDSIAPGDSLEGFGLRSPFFPGIRATFAQPTWASCCSQQPAQGPRPTPNQFRVKGWAVAPTYAPTQVTLDVLRDLLDRSCGEVAWITPASACNPLREPLVQAATSARSGDRDGARERVRAFLGALDANHGTGRPVSDNAYWLLRIGAGYLSTHAATAVWLDPFPSWALGELAALKGGGTTADWMRTHPTETLATFGPATLGSAEDWCARATTEQPLPDSLRVIRRAYFFPPTLTPQSTLPASAGPEILARRCVLGAVWVAVGVPTTPDGIRLNTEMGHTLVSVYHGAPRPVHSQYEPPFGGFASSWQVAGLWVADSTTVLSAAEIGFLRHGPRVMALAYGAGSGLGRPEGTTVVSQYTRDSTSVAEAAALTGLEARRTVLLVSLLARAESARARLTHPERGALRSVAVRTLWHWLSYARPLAPARRAAAYLAADRLLGTHDVGILFAEPEDTAEGHLLQAWGAEFEERYMAGFVYTHSWLAQAVSLDPTSRAGNLAFMSLIGGCDPGKAIEQGVAFMPNLSDPALRAQLNFILGDAYADSVGMAAQVNLGPSYRDKVRDAPTSRAKAIEYYRAGLAIDRSSVGARAAWRKAWRLLAGQPPLGLVFYCEGD